MRYLTTGAATIRRTLRDPYQCCGVDSVGGGIFGILKSTRTGCRWCSGGFISASSIRVMPSDHTSTCAMSGRKRAVQHNVRAQIMLSVMRADEVSASLYGSRSGREGSGVEGRKHEEPSKSREEPLDHHARAKKYVEGKKRTIAHLLVVRLVLDVLALDDLGRHPVRMETTHEIERVGTHLPVIRRTRKYMISSTTAESVGD